MTLTTEILFQNLVHIGALLYLACFLFRNQIILRLLAIGGDIVYTIYYYIAAEIPLWNAMYWSILTIAINVVMIAVILNEKRAPALGDDELDLFRRFSSMTPRQFRQLAAQGHWMRNSEIETLTLEGGSLDKLYYVLEGELTVVKLGQTIQVAAPVFIGELAYLRQKPATATVRVAPGARYMVWEHTALGRITGKDTDFKAALNALINADMAEKMARA
jgi:hypothetical protein